MLGFHVGSPERGVEGKQALGRPDSAEMVVPLTTAVKELPNTGVGLVRSFTDQYRRFQGWFVFTRREPSRLRDSRQAQVLGCLPGLVG